MQRRSVHCVGRIISLTNFSYFMKLSDNSAEYEEKRVAEALAASKAAERERMAENISESKTTSFPPKP